MKKQISPKLIALSFSVLTILFLTAFYVFAVWTEPTAAPPEGNVDAPVDVGASPQRKAGPLTIGGVFETESETHLAILGGNVGIGTTSPAYKLEIKGSGVPEIRLEDSTTFAKMSVNEFPAGTQAPGATYGTVSNHGINLATNNQARLTILSGGNVGIGTTNPGAKLEVNGQVKITGGSPGANKVLTSDDSGLASWETLGGGFPPGTIIKTGSDGPHDICTSPGSGVNCCYHQINFPRDHSPLRPWSFSLFILIFPLVRGCLSLVVIVLETFKE